MFSIYGRYCSMLKLDLSPRPPEKAVTPHQLVDHYHNVWNIILLTIDLCARTNWTAHVKEVQAHSGGCLPLALYLLSFRLVLEFHRQRDSLPHQKIPEQKIKKRILLKTIPGVLHPIAIVSHLRLIWFIEDRKFPRLPLIAIGGPVTTKVPFILSGDR